MMDKRVYDLLSRYLSGVITEKELNELKQEVELTGDPELGLYLSGLWEEYENRDTAHEEVLGEILQNITQQSHRQSRRLFIRRLGKAAAILLLPLLSALTVYFFQSRSMELLAGDPVWRVEAEKGQQATVILADGTKVRLNAESSLSYRRNYGIKDREVELMGEGFFEVAKEEGKPFIVRTSLLDVEVLGTVFNVYAYECEDIVEMSLLSGCIKVMTHTDPVQTVYLKPNEKILYNKGSGNMEVVSTDNRFETAWLTGGLVFRSVELQQVLRQLERKYGVAIHWEDPDILQDKFTGVFYSDRITDVLKILHEHYAFSYQIRGEEVFITTTP